MGRTSGAQPNVHAALRVGVVGLGAIAQTAHLPSLSKQRGVKVAALCDNDASKARTLAARFDVAQTFGDIEEMLEGTELDTLVVCTPNHLHEPHVLAALKAGLHVLCERPLALTARGVERILATAQKADRRVLVANNLRFRADVQGLAGFLRTNELGRMQAIRAGAQLVRGEDAAWRQRRAEAGGGAFLEHGLPLLDLALWLAQGATPTRISALMERARGANAVEQAMVVGIECDDGPTIALDIRHDVIATADRWWFQTFATKGAARLAPLRITKELHGRAMDVSPAGAATRETPFLQSYRAQCAHVTAVWRGEVAYKPPTDQLLLYRVVEAIYKSAEDGKEVRWPSA